MQLEQQFDQPNTAVKIQQTTKWNQREIMYVRMKAPQQRVYHHIVYMSLLRYTHIAFC